MTSGILVNTVLYSGLTNANLGNCCPYTKIHYLLKLLFEDIKWITEACITDLLFGKATVT